jgi:hypothetical protein
VLVQSLKLLAVYRHKRASNGLRGHGGLQILELNYLSDIGEAYESFLHEYWQLHPVRRNVGIFNNLLSVGTTSVRINLSLPLCA